MSNFVKEAIRILLIAPYALYRESIGQLLVAEPGFEIASNCGSLEEALQALKQNLIDIAVLDFDFEERNCREFIYSARNQGFGGKVLLLSAGVHGRSVGDLIRAGISGIFLKHNSATLLGQVIRDVTAGRVWFDQEQLQSALRDQELGGHNKRFTERERQVLSYLFDGIGNRKIAAQIGVSESSVKASLQQLFEKTGVRTRSQLVRIALEQYKDQLL